MTPKKSQKKEIWYHVINAALAGALVLLGSFASGKITLEGVFFATVAALVVVISRFKEYWDGEAGEYSNVKILQFLG